MGFMGIRECKTRKAWSSMIAIALACLLTVPVTTGQTDSSYEVGAVDRPTAPNPIPILTLSLYPAQLEAKVTEDQLGAVTYGGNATVEQLRIMTSKVTLTAVVNTGWPVVISPSTIEFTGSGTERFTVTVIVPPATSALITGNVIVVGTCKAPLLAPIIASASAIVTVGTYYDISVSSRDHYVSLSPGESDEISLQIWNEGNGIATVTPSVESAPKNVNIDFHDDILVINPEDFENLTVLIKATENAPRGGHEVLIYFTVAEDQSLNGSHDTAFSLTLSIPTMAEEIGYPVIASLVVLACIGVAVAILWKMDKLSKLKGIRLPKRTKVEG